MDAKTFSSPFSLLDLTVMTKMFTVVRFIVKRKLYVHNTFSEGTGWVEKTPGQDLMNYFLAVVFSFRIGHYQHVS